MTRVHMFHQSDYPSKFGIILLGSVLLLGCIAGIWLSCEARSWFADAVQALRFPPDGFASLTALTMPLLFSVLAVYVKRPVLLLPLAFWKALFFSYVFSGFIGVCGSAGWLICGLCMFSRIASLPVLCWYWLRHISGQCFCFSAMLLAFALLVALCLADLWVISPFLAKILIL